MSILKNEKGSALIVALILLAVVACLGAAISHTVQVEIICAKNDYYHKRAFYAADSGVTVASEILKKMEQNDEVTEELNETITNQTLLDDYGSTVECEFEATMTATGLDEHNKPIVLISSTGYYNGAVAVVEAEFRVRDMYSFKVTTPLYVDGLLGGNGASNSALAEWGYCDYDANCDHVAHYDIVSTQDVVIPDPDGTDDINWRGETVCDPCFNHFDLPEGVEETEILAPNTEPDPDASLAEIQASFDDTFENLLKFADPVEPQNNLSLPGDYDDMKVYYYSGEEFRVQNIIEGWGILLIDGDFVLGGNIEWHGIIMVKGESTFDGGGTQEIYGSFFGKGNTTINGRPQFYYDCRVLNAILKEYNNYYMTWWRVV